MRTAHHTRREFTCALAGLAAAAGLPVPAVGADQENASLTGALEEIVRSRFGKVLTPDQQRQIARTVRQRLRAGEFLRGIPLKNSDEPAFVFQADVP